MREIAVIEERGFGKVRGIKDLENIALVHPPHNPAVVTKVNPIILHAERAPGLVETWGQTRPPRS